MVKPAFEDKEIINKNQDGQSLVEFVLLLSIIMVLSLGFLKTVNTGIATYWLKMGQMLVEDDSQTLELR
ncbi:MAG: hypothetical protein CME64_06995 [Halobacteriovoraceae bacterium]|nr:hypothetical protein [Halobacteriovoraceae bacterium]|tara:strand:- start:22402 stop:22608 length:207 start_codon:yes stop_codon:yes gene_type:complete